MTPDQRARFVAGFEAAMRDRCGRPIYGSYGAVIGTCPAKLSRKGIAVNGGGITVLVTCPTCDWR